MKIITTFYHLNHLEMLSAHADGFLIGNDRFGTRLTTSFDVNEVVEALDITKKMDKMLFLVANQLFTDDHLSEFENWIKALPTQRFEGIIVSDLGAVRVLTKLGLQDKIIYNPETLLTNSYDFNFLSSHKIYGAFVAKEITLEDVLVIGNKKKYAIFMVGHGHLNMFYSKRQLIDNFMTFTKSENPYHNQQDLTLIEETRNEEPYPIIEDFAGTHVFRSQVLSSLNYLDKLDSVVDYLVVDTLFKDDDYAKRILPLYHHRNHDHVIVDQIKHDYHESWDEGFFNTKTIYKQRKKDD